MKTPCMTTDEPSVSGDKQATPSMATTGPVAHHLDASPHLVVGGQFLALAGQGISALGEVSATALDFGVAAQQFSEGRSARPQVEVDEQAVVGVGGVLSSGEPGQLGLEEFVVGCWCRGG